MDQVILNLLTNARDAMAETEGEKKITLRVFEDENSVHLTSQDTGGGIPDPPPVFLSLSTRLSIWAREQVWNCQ